MARHFFTAEDDRQILTLRAGGMTHVQVAAATGLALGSIYSRVSLLRSKGVRTPADLAAIGGTIIVTRPGNFTPADVALIAAMRQAGMTYREIAQETGFSMGSLHRHGRVVEGKTPVVPSADIAEKAAKARAARQAYADLHPFSRKSRKREMVRCLGGCGQQFASPDRLRIRIFPHCKELRKRAPISDVDDYSLRL